MGQLIALIHSWWHTDSFMKKAILLPRKIFWHWGFKRTRLSRRFLTF